MRDTLRELLTEALSKPLPQGTRRDVRVPGVPGKAFAVIGMRRAGKTSFLWQVLADRLRAGHPRESLVLLGFEDERLTGMPVSELTWLLEEYYRLHPEWRGSRTVTLCLDEIQLVPGWETFVRRLIDTEKIEVFVSGSSARMLSREVASSMRGRGLEVVVHPFSFRESLRHAGVEPDKKWHRLSKAIRSDLDRRLRTYLLAGGFPEAQNLPAAERLGILRSYVDLAVLRDVIDRHAVSNPVALRWLQRQLLSTTGGTFSVSRFYQALRSQGFHVAKETLHAYLGYFEDAFVVKTVSMHSASERQRMSNPRKAYPIDTGFIQLYERHDRANLGHALEAAVLLELDRRGYEVDYVRTPEGFEIDFHAFRHGSPPLLVQVCTEVNEPAVFSREVRALQAGMTTAPRAKPLLITLDSLPPREALPKRVEWRAAAEWLLSPEETEKDD